jgi:hypothetical protein
MLRRFLVRWLVWLDARDERRRERRALLAFPRGASVEVMTGCKCGGRFVGQRGTVLGLSSSGAELEPIDYRIRLDGREDEYELICGRALRRL